MQLFELDKSAPFYVAGHNGMVGSAIWRLLEREGFTNLLGRTSKELDLRDRASVFAFFEEFKPRYVVLAAARVGGILANDSKPVEFLSDNLQIQVNVLDAALKHDVERLVFLGSSCIYPKDAPQPLREEYLMTGPLEPTNEAYATAKIAGIKQIQAVRKQFGKHWISVMPTNLYGPGDNYTDGESHVMAALIKRFVEAKRENLTSVTNWGSGKPLREFLHVDDLAKALFYLLSHYDGPEPINVGSGREVSIRELSNLIQETVGYSGRVSWDLDKPDGVFRKLMATSPELVSLFAVDLESGVRSVVRELKGEIG
jgi:GDP-L-fucose synthase